MPKKLYKGDKETEMSNFNSKNALGSREANRLTERENNKVILQPTCKSRVSN